MNNQVRKLLFDVLESGRSIRPGAKVGVMRTTRRIGSYAVQWSGSLRSLERH